MKGQGNIMLSYKSYQGTAEVSIEDGVLHGRIMFIDDLVTYEAGDVGSLRREFEAAVEDYIQTCNSLNKQPQRPCSGTFQVRISPETHRAACLRAISDRVTLNEVVVRAMDSYLNESARVHHDVRVTFEPTENDPQIVRAALSLSTPQWRTARVN